jgi:hypothetical protein
MFDDVVTWCFRVLRICVGVLRDVTVLADITAEPRRRPRPRSSSISFPAAGICSRCRATATKASIELSASFGADKPGDRPHDVATGRDASAVNDRPWVGAGTLPSRGNKARAFVRSIADKVSTSTLTNPRLGNENVITND